MNNFEKYLIFLQKAPLNLGDSENTTYGCRHSSPDICGSCYIENACAFNSADNIWEKPSTKWKNIHKKLSGEV